MSNNQFTIYVSSPDRYLQNCFGTIALVNAFESLVEYMLKKETALIVRSEHATIGVSRPNERYWFYVSWKEGKSQIKFQHWSQSEPFKKGLLNQYKQACDEVAALYRNSPETFYTGSRTTKSEPTFAEKNALPAASIAVANSSPNPTEPLRSCESCHLRRNEACSSLRGEVCEDYEAAFTISEEEKALWPKEMDSTRIKVKIGRQQEKKRSSYDK